MKLRGRLLDAEAEKTLGEYLAEEGSAVLARCRHGKLLAVSDTCDACVVAEARTRAAEASAEVWRAKIAADAARAWFYDDEVRTDQHGTIPPSGPLCSARLGAVAKLY